MRNDLLTIIKGRKSVRTFDGGPVSAGDREQLEGYARKIANPFGIPVRFAWLDAKELGLSSPVSIQGGAVCPHPGRLNALHTKLTCNILKEEYITGR